MSEATDFIRGLVATIQKDADEGGYHPWARSMNLETVPQLLKLIPLVEAGERAKPGEFLGRIAKCPRCDGDHIMSFTRFQVPCDRFTHWATCPTTGDPVLLVECQPLPAPPKEGGQ